MLFGLILNDSEWYVSDSLVSPFCGSYRVSRTSRWRFGTKLVSAGRIFQISSTSDVTLDLAQTTTGNEAASFVSKRPFPTFYSFILDGKYTVLFEKAEANGGAEKRSNRHLGATTDKVLLAVVEFAEEGPLLKWFLRFMSIMLLVALAVLWVYYR